MLSSGELTAVASGRPSLCAWSNAFSQRRLHRPSPAPALVEDGRQEAALAHALKLEAVAAHLGLRSEGGAVEGTMGGELSGQ